MTEPQRELLAALAAALFDNSPPNSLSEEAREEAESQAVYSLVCGDKQTLQIVSRNMKIAWEQKKLVNCLSEASIPCVVLKGLAAAMYYPDPVRRSLGDIDIIVRPEDFHKAFTTMLEQGCTTEDSPEGSNRHAHFQKAGITIELHRNFAALNTRAAEESLDGWIFEAIPQAVTGSTGEWSFPVLPEPLNGLTLLAHISQHLEGGLGLRQLVDWVMYVARELPDEKWPAFQRMTEPLGLTQLAKTSARLGQIYLGLPEQHHRWCMDADASVCEALLEYAFECGNFGKKAGMNNTVTMVLSHSDGLRGAFRNLQDCGERNWKAYQKHRWLKPFCWLYQIIRYARFGLKRENAFSNLKKDYAASRRRNELMTALGATRLVERNR